MAIGKRREPTAGGKRKLTWREAEIASPEHGGGEARHNGLRLHVQVTVHFVRSPVTDQSDTVAVNACAQQCHGAARASGADGDISLGVHGVVGVEMENGSGALRQIRGRNVTEGGGIARANRVQRGVECSVLRAKRARTRDAMAASTGHKCGCPERPWPMVSLRTPFFCWVKVSVANVAAKMSASEQERRSREREPIQSLTCIP